MPPISLLIKPASSNCNLRCKYCFYHAIADSRTVKSYGLMSLETLEAIVKKTLEFADQFCNFAFQGGEPTLIGLDFFEKLIEFQEKHNVKKVKISNSIQTNGTLIDEKWAEFLNKHNFLVGLSLDGNKDTHDLMRFDANLEGTFNKVMRAVSLFNKYKVEYNILFVVNSNVARYIEKIYSFFKKHDFKYLQFNPCLDPLDETPGGQEHSLTPERFEHFLKTLFDLWYTDVMADNLISIRYFDNILSIMLGYPPESCGMSGVCTCQFVIEADGGVYPCDFYVNDDWLLGNILEQGYFDLKHSEKCIEFEEVSKHIDPKCRECKWGYFCRGGCRRDREPFKDGKPGLNFLCTAFENFFEYSIPRFEEIARRIKK
ncbi:MAG: anaerobic sulfatase maturase [Bacillota bacterium]